MAYPRWVPAAVGAVALLLAGCPAADTEREHSTDVDRQRAAALRADRLLAGAAVSVGDAYTGAFPGWRRTRGEREITVPATAAGDPVGRARHVHQVLADLLADARTAGWQVFTVRCAAATGVPVWSLHGHRQLPGYLADLQLTARLADRDPSAADGVVSVRLLAPYHLDPASLVGDPPPAAVPAGRSCLDQPYRPGTDESAGTDIPVTVDHRD